MKTDTFCGDLSYEKEKAGKWKIVIFNTVKTAAIFAFAVTLAETLHLLHFGNQNLIMVYILSVLIISRITPGYIYGIAAAALSALTYDFFVTAPRMGFSFTLGFPITLCSMLLVTLVTSTLTTQIKTQAALAINREHRAELLYEINQQLLASRDIKTIIRLTNKYIIEHLRRSVIFYTCDPYINGSGTFEQSPFDSGSASHFCSDSERKTAHGIFKNALSYRQGTKSGYENSIFYIPVISKENTLGLVGISCKNGALNQSNLIFTQMLIGQVALALELQYLSDEQRSILVDTEREKMRGTLLRAISHDLRTPLTIILGASSTVLEQKNSLDAKTHDKLVTDIKDNSQWLIRMVENLLSVTRIEALKLNKTLEAAEEVIAQSVSIVRKRFPDRHIHIKASDELLLVAMDATMISQVIINLLENSIKNSRNGSLILLDFRKRDDYAEFNVSDNGRGIPEQLLDNLFEENYPVREQSIDSVCGMGIGLSICETIVRAHGGIIMGKNRPGGGARFTFLLPLQESDSNEP